MKQYLDLLTRTLVSSPKETSFFMDVDLYEPQFTTSLDVVQKVMNVPVCALESLLRQYGHSDLVGRTGTCIDEKVLDMFADAYVRKMKNYYRNSTRNVSLLSDKENGVLNTFVQQFKKQEANVRKLGYWDDIDSDLIKETFIEKVKELTPKDKELKSESVPNESKMYFEISALDLFLDVGGVSNPHRGNAEYKTLSKVTEAIWYQTKRPFEKLKQLFWDNVTINLRFLFVSARYYLYPADDDDFSHIECCLSYYFKY